MIDDRKVADPQMIFSASHIVALTNLQIILSSVRKLITETAVGASRFVVRHMQDSTVRMQQSNEWIHLGPNRLRDHFERNALASSSRKSIVIRLRTIADSIDGIERTDSLHVAVE